LREYKLKETQWLFYVNLVIGCVFGFSEESSWEKYFELKTKD
jgi:hypothetical protein